MRILITGHRGNLGVPIARHLEHSGHDVAGFDRVDGQDLLDLAEVSRAAAGCAAIVHLGALAHDTAGSPEQIMAVNVLGTWHVLLAAETAGSAWVIHFSSAQVFGIAEGERLPDYFPVDDAHPRRAMRAYGLSKCLGEDLCAALAGGPATTGLTAGRASDQKRNAACEARARSYVRDDKPVADVEAVEFEQVGMVVLPPPSAKIVGQAAQPSAERFVSGLGEHGYPGPDGGVEIGLGTAPVRRGETIGTVMRDRNRPHLGAVQQPGQHPDRLGHRGIDLGGLRKVFRQQPE